VQPIAAYAVNSSPVTMVGWYSAGNPGSKHEVFRILEDSDQTLNPAYSGSSTFDPGTAPFGFYSIWPPFGNREVFTEDALNASWAGSNLHHVRVYPYKYPNGTVVPNAYVLGFEEYTSGWDFNDVVFIVWNVEPAAGQIDFENRDWVTLNGLNYPGMDWVNTWLTFSRIDSGVTNHRLHDMVTLRIHNRSQTNPLTIDSFVMSNPAEYTLPNGEDALPELVIPPGSYHDLLVQFIASGGSKGTRIQTLTITSNDPDDPVSVINLGGSYMSAPEGGYEVHIGHIADAFGYSTTVMPIPQGQWTPAGEEVLSVNWNRLNASQPIYVRQLAAFHSCCGGGANLSISNGGGSMNHAPLDGQSLLPLANNAADSSPAEMFSNPSDGFHVTIDGRTSCGSDCGNNHGVRFWPVRGPSGAVVPGAYLVSMDYVGGGGSTNYDYNDNTYLFTNIEPADTQTDLELFASDTPDPVEWQNNVTYTFSVYNNSFFTASNTTLTINLPAGMTPVSVTPDQGSCTAGMPIVCSLGDVNGEQTVDVTIVVTADTPGTKTATAQVTTDAAESDLADNDVTLTTQVDVSQPATITIVKEATPEGSDVFNFTGDLGSFQLVDDGSVVSNPFSAQYNFQDSLTVMAAGYTPDNGSAYAAKPNGETYGWYRLSDGQPVDATGNARDRGGATAPELRTLMHMQYTGGNGVEGELGWEHTLPNGTYEVTVSVGDASYTDSTHSVRVEGVTAINGFVASAGNLFAQGTVTVDVTDGNLTLDPVGGTNTKINYVTINEIPSPSNTKTFANLAPGSYTLSEIVPAGWTIDGISCTSANFSQFGNVLMVTVAPDEVVTCTFNNSSGGTNTPPTAVDDSANTSEDTPVTFNILSNDNDADGSLDPATVDLDPATGGQQTQMVVGGQGTFDYEPATGEVAFTPEPAFFGVSSIQYTVNDNNGAVSNAATISVNVAQNAVCPVLYRINSGGPAYAAADGTSPDWMQDQKNAPSPYTTLDSSTYTTSTTIDMSDLSLPTSVPMQVFQSERWDGSSPPPMGYAFPVTVGEQYEVRLYFAELYFANPGDRVFAVSIEGNVVLPNYDAVVDAGANFTGVMQSFNITAGDDTLDIGFGHVTENPAVKGIEIISICNAGNEPTPQNDTYNVTQGGTLNVAAPGLLDNDTHPLSDTMTVISNTQPAYAASALTVNADGSFTYTHNGSASLSDSFSYTVQDSSGKTAIATVTIMITGTNQPPSAEDDTATTFDGTLVAIDILGNDTDPDGDALDPASVAVETAALPAGHTVNVLPAGSVEYTPAAGDTGDFSFTYTVADTLGNVSNAATVTVTVTANNDPVAVDDAYTVDQGQTLSEPAPGVLDNDSDSDGHTLTVDSFTQPANGTVTVNADGSFDYTHDGSTTTTDSFTYTMIDGHGGSATATVNMTITAPTNLDPVAVDDNYTLNQGEILNILAPGVLDNDSDPDTDPLVVDSYTQPAYGTLVVNGDGSFSYAHDNSPITTDSFTYTIIDGNGGSATATVNLTVTLAANQNPVAVDDAGYAVDAGQTLNEAAPGVLGNDSDPDAGDTISVDSNTAPAHGTATVNSDGSFNYTHNGDTATSDSFSYTIVDGNGGSASATVTITINQPAPVCGVSYRLNVGGPQIAAADASTPAWGEDQSAILAQGAATLGVPSPYLVDDTPAYGVSGLIDDSDASLPASIPMAVFQRERYDFSSGNPLTYRFPVTAGEQYEVRLFFAELYWTSTGSRVFDIYIEGALVLDNYDTVADAGSNARGVMQAFTVTPADAELEIYFTHEADNPALKGIEIVHLCAPNTAPNAVDDAATVDQGGTIAALDGGAASVLANDNDPDGDNLTVTSTPVTPPAAGSLTLNADGTFSYTHDGSATLIDSFVYEVCDDGSPSLCATATVSIAVNLLNTPPNADDDSATVTEGGTVTLLDGDVASVLDNDSDPDGNNLTVTTTPVTPPASGSLTLNADGTFSYTQDGAPAATDSFEYEVCDDGTPSQCATATVTITINPVNDPPSAVDDTATVDEGATITLLDGGAATVLDNDSDPEGDNLTATTTPITPVANGTLTLNADGTFSYTHDDSETLTDSFVYEVCDDGTPSQCATATVSITINALNDDPVAVGDNYSTEPGQTLNVAAPGVLDNDSDPEGDMLTVTNFTQPTNGTVTVNGDGSFDYTHDGSATIADSFTYTVEDGNQGSATATVNIAINAAGNTLPVAEDDMYATNQGQTLTVTAPGVMDNDTDADGDTLTVESYTQPTNGTVTLNTDGSFDYIHDGSATTNDSFTYMVNDGNGGTDEATVVIYVNVTGNTLPEANDDAYVVDEGNVLVVNVPGVLGNDTDADDDTLTVVDNTEPASGTLSLLPDGSFEYSYTGGAGATDNLNQAQATVATDSFVYTVSDGNGGTNSASVEIIIRSGDESPDPGDDDDEQPVVNLADPAITKLGELQPGDLGLPGEQITWVITVSNPSTVNMTNVVVTDEIVPELRIDGANTDRGTVSISGQVVTFQIPFLNAGESIQMRIATTVLQSPESGEFTNLASVRSDQNTIKTATATVNGVTGLPDTGYRPLDDGAQTEDGTTAQTKSVTEKQGLPLWPVMAVLSLLLLVLGGFFLRWRHA
jgi:uncharacterized repeat protein (TIGR01451 family)